MFLSILHYKANDERVHFYSLICGQATATSVFEKQQLYREYVYGSRAKEHGMEIIDSQFDVYEHIKPRVYFPTDQQAAAMYDVEAIEYYRAYQGEGEDKEEVSTKSNLPECYN